MAEATAVDHGHGTGTGLSNNKLLMWVFLGSECMLFGGLISTYLIYRSRFAEGPAPGDIFDIPFTSVSSFVLLMSSLTMVLALAAIQRGDQRGLRIWLIATALLGTVFIGGQYFEFLTFYRHYDLSLMSNLFGTTFYVLTGFHGAHVTVGIIILLSFVVMSFRGRVAPEQHLNIELAGLYWHFVDVVWIVIFTVIYLVEAPNIV